ncbi:hypothetical protein [Thermococcus sp. MV11]|uniref:hypothetical protein n=1 Tax=Thermococcus sp. MV11 TaxID=1638267 RepID=UPI00142FD0EC|nr:hypothetical protein [Thermococcus sp. MV11]NJE02906.1 hypothetical protein [Thermococcus sp. MV11]
MDPNQVAGMAVIFGAYSLMLYLLYRSNKIIAEMKRRRLVEKRRYAKKKIAHVLEVHRATRHRRQ